MLRHNEAAFGHCAPVESDAQEYRLREQVIALLEKNLQYIDHSFVKGEAGFVPADRSTGGPGKTIPVPSLSRGNDTSGEHCQAEQKLWSITGRLPASYGDSQRGAMVFRNRTCQQCHSGAGLSTSSALGPNLAGAAKRFSRDDLLLR